MTGRPQTPTAARTRTVHDRIEQVACPDGGISRSRTQSGDRLPLTPACTFPAVS